METTNTNNDVQEEQTEDQIEETKKDKTAIIKKVLFATIGVLVLLLIILTFIFILKDAKEDETTHETPISDAKNVQNNQNSIEPVNQEPQVEESKFDFNNLEPEKLNEQLELLTNKNMEHQKEKEEKLLEEEKKLSPILNLVNNLKNKELDKEENTEKQNDKGKETPAQAPKEENNPENEIENSTKEPANISNTEQEVKKSESSQNDKPNAEPSNIETNNNISINKSIVLDEKTTQKTNESTFVKLINVAKIKGNLNKKYLDKAVDVNSNILLCRDDENIIELYYGPFLEDKLRDDLLSKLIKNGFKEAYSLEMTKEEFDKRCNY